MNEILHRFSSFETMRPGDHNRVIGGIGTVEGRIWIAYQSKKLVKMPIIASDRNIPVHLPLNALQNLDRGPTGNHDVKAMSHSTVELLYCHQVVATIAGTYDRTGNATLCGRTYIMFCTIEEHNDCDDGDDESLVYELKEREHLRVLCGAVKVRVSAAGHRVYLSEGVTHNIYVN